MAQVRAEDLVFRQGEPADDPQVIPLLRAALGKPDDPHYEAFLAWKHRENPFGPSPAWVALHGDRVVGYRTFLRWRFLDDLGRPVAAVRAVDTATLPDYQGLGIFRSLTLRGVADLTLAGDGIVFNTPNDKSRPGYLKMGWSVVRRLPVGVLPAGPRALLRMASSRVASSIWSDPCDVGLDAAEALADPSVARALLVHAPAKGFRTERTPEYLAWRTSFAPLHYRLLLARESDPGRGRHHLPAAEPGGVHRGRGDRATRPRPAHRGPPDHPNAQDRPAPTTRSVCEPGRRPGWFRCRDRGRC